ncbi:MAG TPA: protein-L-isoaspartate O-methyltransferase [Candidatus Nanoarchaeia archaeon]|nr:protein-L-isoaspartate O-methyltransferase [Candidatus Nanoarchaeia archaeon]
MDKKELLALLKGHGFPEEILNAFEKVPREDFVPTEHKKLAYENIALPLEEEGATISQPYTIAIMLHLLELEEGQKVLEIGSGSGYVLALLQEITRGAVYGVEIRKTMAEHAMQRLKGNEHIVVVNQDGQHGLQIYAPYDRIIISASQDTIPTHLYAQLKEDGILVAPIRASIYQIKKLNGEILKKEIPYFSFVPLVKSGAG